jgi:hypothetical protein
MKKPFKILILVLMKQGIIVPVVKKTLAFRTIMFVD